ncbi:MAG: hypothetical protein BWY31_04230 [Lentisphaerae bacterium ADurb.Bin242]|nr:MAG: hypothetical protein BWY31_04230 [Lentisphaerae bacterium ADurb.Bin242]
MEFHDSGQVVLLEIFERKPGGFPGQVDAGAAHRTGSVDDHDQRHRRNFFLLLPFVRHRKQPGVVFLHGAFGKQRFPPGYGQQSGAVLHTPDNLFLLFARKIPGRSFSKDQQRILRKVASRTKNLHRNRLLKHLLENRLLPFGIFRDQQRAERLPDVDGQFGLRHSVETYSAAEKSRTGQSQFHDDGLASRFQFRLLPAHHLSGVIRYGQFNGPGIGAFQGKAEFHACAGSGGSRIGQFPEYRPVY